MYRNKARVLFTIVAATLVGWGATGDPGWSQTIRTEGNIETDGQLVSKVATGTAPLAVSSTTLVSGLNGDLVDGLEGTDLALEADLQNAEALLMAIQSQLDSLGFARLPRTGQTNCYDAAGAVVTCGAGIGLAQDGDLQLGVTWPNPRFKKNGDGTVMDRLTGLIWLENADCFGMESWADALAAASGLFDGSTNDPGGGDCGLSDGSAAGVWRVPNLRELQSLVHYGVFSPSVPNTAGTGQWSAGDPFTNVVPAFSWSSTTNVSNADFAWVVSMFDGNVNDVFKDTPFRFWPVRGGQ